jgi:hypothetical protein
MKTKFADDIIHPRLTKPETSPIVKAVATCKKLAVMQPIRVEITAAAKTAMESLTTLVGMVGCDAPDYLPLIDGQAHAGTPASDPPPATDTPVETMSKGRKGK